MSLESRRFAVGAYCPVFFGTICRRRRPFALSKIGFNSLTQRAFVRHRTEDIDWFPQTDDRFPRHPFQLRPVTCRIARRWIDGPTLLGHSNHRARKTA